MSENDALKKARLVDQPYWFAIMTVIQYSVAVTILQIPAALVNIDGIGKNLYMAFITAGTALVIGAFAKMQAGEGFFLGVRRKGFRQGLPYIAAMAAMAIFIFVYGLFRGGALRETEMLSNLITIMGNALASEFILRGVVAANTIRLWKYKKNGILYTLGMVFVFELGMSLVVLWSRITTIECLVTNVIIVLMFVGQTAMYLRTRNLWVPVVSRIIIGIFLEWLPAVTFGMGWFSGELLPTIIVAVLTFLLVAYILRPSVHDKILATWDAQDKDDAVMESSNQTFSAFYQYLPDLLRYHLCSTIIIGLSFAIVKEFSVFLLGTIEHGSFTSGDFGFLFRTWQGYVFILLYMIVYAISMALDINGLIILGDKLIHDQKARVRDVLKEAFLSLRMFMNKEGLLVGIYVAILAPAIGFFMTLSVTRRFYIPNFITSVVYNTPLYLTLYVIVVIVLLLMGLRYIFLVPFVVLDGKTPKEAMKLSHEMIRKRWIRFYFHMTSLSTKIAILSLGVTGLITALPFAAQMAFNLDPSIVRFLNVFCYMIGAVLGYVITFMEVPAMTIELTRLFLSYRDGKPVYLARKRDHVVTWRWLLVGAVGLAILTPIALGITLGFDELFVPESKVKVIAHRLGGNERAENTIAGERYSIRHGYYAVETDVQRTKDGYYVINHDNTFKRVCGVDRHVKDMTLAEIKELKINDEYSVATLEQVLDTAKGKIRVFIELKGECADRQMADDVMKMIEERDMVDECTIISLDYQLMKYVHNTYPEIETGLLYFFAYGDTTKLDVDVLIMEEETANPDRLYEITQSGKKAVVWTINTEDSARKYLDSYADAIITDEMSMCENIREQMTLRSDVEMLEAMFNSD